MRHRYVPSSFVDKINSHMKKGQEHRDWCMEGYCWAYDHLGEIRRHDQDFSLEWLRGRLKAIFNIDPASYKRVLQAFGGEDGRYYTKIHRIMDGVGIYLWCQAFSMLLAAQRIPFVMRLSHSVDSDEFKEILDQFYKEGAGSGEIVVPEQKPGIDYRREYFRILKEKRELEREIMQLRKENAKLEKVAKAILEE